MKRAIDFLLATTAIGTLAIPMGAIAAAVKFTSKGPALYWSVRVGKDNKHFKCLNFAQCSPRHLKSRRTSSKTPCLSYSHRQFLRKTSLDELPQLWSILTGDMSFVGPRPALHNQDDLIELRTSKGVHSLVPGLTGWAQINGRDELPIPEKVNLDVEYLESHSVVLDVKIILLTAARVLRSSDVSH